MKKCFHVDIVSPEVEIFSGLVQKLFMTGVEGELEILCGHAPFLTALSPGPVWAIKEDGNEEAFVILGGMLEVQPDITIVLADVALRANDIDEAAATAAIKNVQRDVQQRKSDLDYAKAHTEIAAAVAQLRVIRRMRKQLKR